MPIIEEKIFEGGYKITRIRAEANGKARWRIDMPDGSSISGTELAKSMGYDMAPYAKNKLGRVFKGQTSIKNLFNPRRRTGRVETIDVGGGFTITRDGTEGHGKIIWLIEKDGEYLCVDDLAKKANIETSYYIQNRLVPVFTGRLKYTALTSKKKSWTKLTPYKETETQDKPEDKRGIIEIRKKGMTLEENAKLLSRLGLPRLGEFAFASFGPAPYF